jgi:hypothetical protein
MSLKMMLGVLMPEREFSLAELEEITHKQPDAGAFATHHLIWMVENGLEVQHWDTHDWPAFRDDGLDYIRRTVGDDAANYAATGSDIPAEQAVIDRFLEVVPMIKKKPRIADMEQLFDEGWLVRAGVNSRVLNNRDGYVGHSVVITGFEDDDVIFHDPDVPGTANRRSPRELFQAAMDSFGGEIDAVRQLSKR